MFGSTVRSKLALAVVVPIAAATIAVATPQMAGSAAASGIAHPVPVVVSFTSSKATVPNSGGSFALKARLKYGQTCKLSVSPAMKGFPKSFSCTTSFSKTVDLSKNKGENPETYTFSVKAINKSGSASGTNVVVTQGAAPPPISFTPTTLNFAPEGVFVGDDPLIVTVHNNSSTTQLISSVSIGTTGDPTDFILNRNNCSYVTAHANCSLAVQFQPTGAGLRTGAVEVVDSSWGTSGATATLNLRGAGVWATATVENADISSNVLTFANQGVLTASPYQYVSVDNVGSVPLYISNISVTGGESTDFSIQDGNCLNQLTGSFPLVVGIGQSCTFGVLFEPSSSSTRTTNLVVSDNTLGTQTQLGLSGLGVWATDTLQIGSQPAQAGPVSYDFSPPSVAVGGGADAILTVTNNSPVSMLIQTVTMSGPYAGNFTIPTATCAGGNQVPSGQSCTMTIDFAPVITGNLFATLRITDNTAAGGDVIDLSGTAVS
jgi:hypothetical protein